MTTSQFLTLVMLGGLVIICVANALACAVSTDPKASDRLIVWMVGMIVTGMPLAALLDTVLP